MARTAQLKKTSEQRCREAFEEVMTVPPPESPGTGTLISHALPLSEAWWAWRACWRYLESRLIEEIQS